MTMNETATPTIRFVVAERRSKFAGGDTYEAHIRMPDGKTFRWKERIYTYIGWPQEQASKPTLYYDIPGFGSVRYKYDALNYVLERMEDCPDEFERMYVRGAQH